MEELIGLVLAGGMSKRMGIDKALMRYHGVCQYQYVHDQLKQVGCNPILVNSNSLKDNNFEIMKDSSEFTIGGPLRGLLTVYNKYQSSSIFLMGIDYPFVSNQTLMKLVEHFKLNNKSVCYVNPINSKLEPLLSIFSKTDLDSLLEFYRNGGISIYKFLEFINCDVLEIEYTHEFENKNYQ